MPNSFLISLPPHLKKLNVKTSEVREIFVQRGGTNTGGKWGKFKWGINLDGG